MAVRMFVAEQSESIARPLLMLTDFLRSGGPQHLQQLAELFTTALFRPVGAIGGVADATEFTARLMGKVENVSDDLRLEEDFDNPPSMPSGDDSQSVVSDETPPALVSPSVPSPVDARPARERRRSEPFACCGMRSGERKKEKRKSAPVKMRSTDESCSSPTTAAVPPSPFSSKETDVSPVRRHPSKPHAPRKTGNTPQPRQDSVKVKRVVFGSDKPLGLVLGSDEHLDVFVQGIGAYAAKRGLRPGMRILSLQGEDTRRLPLHEVSQMLSAAGRPLVMDLSLPVDLAPQRPSS